MTDMAIVARAAGGPEVLEWIAQDTPAPGPGEARIAQRAIGVNFIDTYYRSGSYPWPTTPLIPGAEAAGVESAGVSACAAVMMSFSRRIGACPSTRSRVR